MSSKLSRQEFDSVIASNDKVEVTTKEGQVFLLELEYYNGDKTYVFDGCEDRHCYFIYTGTYDIVLYRDQGGDREEKIGVVTDIS